MKIQRREFILKTGLAAAGLGTLPSTTFGSGLVDNKNGANEIIKKLSLLNDKNLAVYLGRQINKPRDRWNGGVHDQFKMMEE